MEETELDCQALFERTSDGILILDLEGKCLLANRPAAAILGHRPAVLEGRNLAQLLASPALETACAALARLLAGERLQTTEWLLTRHDGLRIPVEIDAALVPQAPGRAGYVQCLLRDLRARKQGEAERELLLMDLINRSTQLLTAADVSKSISTILDPEELIRETVDLIQDRFGFYYVGLFLVESGDGIAALHAGTGQAGRQMLDAGHRLPVGGRSMVGLCVASGEARIALDVGEEAVHFDNPYLPETRSELALPLNVRGECIGALTVQSLQESAFSAGDVTILQSMADQLAVALLNARLYDQVQRYATRLEDLVAERTAELRAVNQELEAFAYSVSHDLRAPLRSIDGFGQALLEDYGRDLDGTAHDYVRRMCAASQRMGGLIDDLLHLSRLTRREMHRQVVNLSVLASSVARELRAAEPHRRVHMVVAGGLTAYGDPGLLRILLENLLGNAYKFTARHATARIEFGAAQEEGETVYFVRDDGAGFDMAYADKLFGAFQRLHRVTEFEGAGIGLATVQRIVHRHGGRVWAQGAVEQGATFYFTLASREGETHEQQDYPPGGGRS
ncbi:MAG: ATP-binding protein [Anaerolineae bacterium]|jgi:PAS domain S-box-containing protein